MPVLDTDLILKRKLVLAPPQALPWALPALEYLEPAAPWADVAAAAAAVAVAAVAAVAEVVVAAAGDTAAGDVVVGVEVVAVGPDVVATDVVASAVAPVSAARAAAVVVLGWTPSCALGAVGIHSAASHAHPYNCPLGQVPPLLHAWYWVECTSEAAVVHTNLE